MKRLFDVPQEAENQDLFNMVRAGYAQAMAGQSDQFFYNIDLYLGWVKTAQQRYAIKGKGVIESLATSHNWKKKEELQETVTDMYSAIFGVLEDFVCVGVDMENDKSFLPSALYSRNISILEELASNGQLETDPTKAISHLQKTKTANSVHNGTFVTYRLDLVKNEGGKPVFKVVVPQSAMEIGVGKRFVMIPVPFFYLFEDTLSLRFPSSAFQFTKTTEAGSSTHIATFSQDIVKQFYTGTEENLIESKLNKVQPGFDILRQRFSAYNLESSVYERGESSFRPFMLDSINAHPLSEATINKALHNIDPNLLRGIYQTRVSTATGAKLDTVTFMDLSGYATVKDKQGALLQYGLADNMSLKDLYFLMQTNKEIFGDLDKSLETRERLAPKFLKTFKPVELPEEESVRIDKMKDMLKSGLVQFIAERKDGTVYEVISTLNNHVMERMYGKDYIKKYDSPSSRLYNIRYEIDDGKINTQQDLEKALVEYNLSDQVDVELFLSGVDGANQAITAAEEALKERSKNRKMPENLVMYRRLYATEPQKTYGSVNVNRIISMEYSPVEAQ